MINEIFLVKLAFWGKKIETIFFIFAHKCFFLHLNSRYKFFCKQKKWKSNCKKIEFASHGEEVLSSDIRKIQKHAPHYVSLEMQEETISTPGADLWALWCISIYRMHVGKTPFEDETEVKTWENILNSREAPDLSTWGGPASTRTLKAWSILWLLRDTCNLKRDYYLNKGGNKPSV